MRRTSQPPPCALGTLVILATHAPTGSHAQARRFLAETLYGPPNNGPKIALGVTAAVVSVVVVMAILIGFILRKRSRKVSPDGGVSPVDAGKEENKKDITTVVDPPHQTALLYMTFNDVQVATEGFKPEGLLSESHFATVHKADGPNGEKWAAKCSKEVSLQGEHLFRNEVEFLARIVHENIVPLRAFCDEGDEQILVFDYMSNGSLASWLRPPADDDRAPLSLSARYKIAVGISEALRFLHSFSHPKIIHRDLQSDSILLDSDFKVKVGGLGLLKHLPGDSLRMRMAGKKGYLDPEYFQTFKVTTKCDVYSFGVVLFEILTGCAPMVQVSRSETQRTFTLAQWAKQAVEENKLDEILDPRMAREDTPRWREKVEGLARIACACVTPLRRHRPDMAKVAEQLAKLRSGAGDTSFCGPQFLAHFMNKRDDDASSTSTEESS